MASAESAGVTFVGKNNNSIIYYSEYIEIYHVSNEREVTFPQATSYNESAQRV